MPVRLFLIIITLVGVTHAQTEEEIEKWFDRGEVCVSRGQWKRATTYFEKVLKAEPDDEEVAHHLSNCYLAIGRYEELGKLTEAWLAKSEKPRPWLIARLDWLREVGRDDDAVALIEKTLGPAGKDYLLESMLGDIHSLRGRDKEALAVFERLVDRAKTEVVKKPEDLIGLGRAYMAWKHGLDNAEKVVAEAQGKVRNKKNLRATALLVEIYRQKELPSDMSVELREALEQRKRWPKFLVAMSDAAALRLGQAESKRRENLQEALRVNPRDPSALFRRGMDELGDAQWAKARETFAKGLAVNPNHMECLSGMVALTYVTHESAEYETWLKRVLDRDPTHGAVHRIVASALNERRRWDDALAAMERAVEVDPEGPKLWEDLARYAFYLGDEKKGHQALEKADKLVQYGSVWRNNMNTVLRVLEKHYETIPSEHYVIKMHRSDRPVMGRYLPAFIEESWRELSERYGFEPEAPVLFEMFKRHDDFSARTMGTTGLGALGVCFGRTVTMDSPRAQRAGTYNWAATAHHEFAHVVTLQMSRGRVPRWLTEGLSTYEEVRRNPSWGRNMEIQLHDALHNDALLNVLEFDKAFRTSRIIFAYYQGGLACQYIIDRWGWDAICKMLRLYGEDKLTPVVLKEALAATPEEFDAGFVDWVRKKLAPMDRVPTYLPGTISRAKADIAAGKNVNENRIKVAWGYFRRGQGFDSDEALKPLIDGNVSDMRIDLLLAARAVRNRRPDLAKEHFQKALDAGSKDFTMLVAMAKLAEEDKDFEKAVDFWKRAAQSNPWAIAPDSAPPLALARIALGEGDRDTWAAELEKYVALVDTAIDVRLELLKHYRAKNDVKRCLALLDDLNNVVPFRLEPHIIRGELLAGMDDFEGARVEFEVALDLGPEGENQVKIRVQLAKVLLRLDQGEDAIYHLERALELDPENEEAKKLMEQAGGN